MDNAITTTLPMDTALAALLPAAVRDTCMTAGCAKGERLFETGKEPAWMYFVAAGEVVLQRPGVHGETVILQRTRHGFIGEASLESVRYHCDGVATAASIVTQVPIPAIRASLASDPAFAIRWIGMLNRELKRLRGQCERLSLNKVQDRLLHLLETEGRQGRFPLGAGLKSLAGELGVSHEALYRCVADMERRNFVRRDAGCLCLAVNGDKLT
jgi:CRP/FNR family transcriptional regulator, dissimilatory nitrate respiration regulator